MQIWDSDGLIPSWSTGALKRKFCAKVTNLTGTSYLCQLALMSLPDYSVCGDEPILRVLPVSSLVDDFLDFTAVVPARD